MHSPEAPYIHTSTITRLARKVPEALFTPANTKARLARQVLSLRYKHPLEYAAKAATPEEKKRRCFCVEKPRQDLPHSKPKKGICFCGLSSISLRQYASSGA